MILKIEEMRTIMIILLLLSTLLILLLLVLILISPGKPSPVKDREGKIIEGSFSEKVFEDINGSRQGMFIRSSGRSNPVLLYVHGGMPDYFLDRKYNSHLERIFTVVWWEQRGSGISYDPLATVEDVTTEQLIEDITTLAKILKQRFGKDRIYLMGHSGGTFVAIKAASLHPELYYAYFGVAQISNQLESEKLACNYMLAKYREQGRRKMENRLVKVSVSDTIPSAYYGIRDKAMHELGIGTMHGMKSVVTGLFLSSLLCRDYTPGEKFKMWQAKIRSGVSIIWKDIIDTDLKESVTLFKIPVYFIEGRFDYTCSSLLAKEYFEMIEAPEKKFILFENSAHSPMFEESEKMIDFLESVIKEDVAKHH